MMQRLSLSPRLRTILRRGLIAAVALVLVALSGVAGLIASRDYSAIERDVIARIEQEAGGALRFQSRRQILWPKPKIVFEAVSFVRTGQDVILKAPQAILNFDLSDLLDGAIDGPAITLIQPEIEITGGRLDSYFRSPRAITDLVDRLAGMFDDRIGFGRMRLSLQQARVVYRDGGGSGEAVELTPVDLRLRFAANRGRIDIFARRDSTIRPLELSASLPTRKSLSQDKSHSASIQISGFESRLAFAGVMRRDPDIALTGRLETSVGEALERMLLPEDGTQQPESRHRPDAKPDVTSLNATATLDPRGVGLETLRIARMGKHLAGIAALREINGRWGVSATLAGDLVDGSAAHAAFQALRNTSGDWSSRPLSINPLPGLDLDIRLSTREFKLGNLILGNVALSILTRAGRAELAIVDSRFGEGTVKARVSLAEAQDGAKEVRLLASGERTDVGKLLEKAFGFNRLTGDGNIVVQAEGRGASVGAIIASLAGSGALEMRSGEVAGIDLARLLVRSTEGRPDTALILSLAGKTPFESMRANFAIKDGRIEPVGSTFVSARVTAMLEGAIDLGAQRHQLVIVLKRRIDEPGQPGEFYAFRLEGPLFSPSLKPDLKLLLNRS